jgi:hypothetical protein
MNKNLGAFTTQHDRSWLALLAFFAATTLASSLLFAAVLAGVTVAIAGGEVPQRGEGQEFDPIVPSQIFSGVITDARCGAKHADSRKNASDCARQCVENGANYTIVDGGSSYELTGNRRQFNQWAGQRVTLTGIREGNKIKVNEESLKPESAR